MSLNIKNERVHAMAREAARRSGKTQTSVIEEALEQYLCGLVAAPGATRGERVLDAARKFDDLLTDADRDQMRNHADWLYDEIGLPK